MTYDITTPCIAFIGDRLLAMGRLEDVADAAKQAFDADTGSSPLVFHATTSQRIDLELGGTPSDVRARLPQAPFAPVRGPGRPKLGVTPREVTLMPRHWEWLATQPGGASVALRKLVEQARKVSSGADDRRVGQDTIYRFMTAICGDFIGYEDATRALFASDKAKFIGLVGYWPKDVAFHLGSLVEAAFPAGNTND